METKAHCYTTISAPYFRHVRCIEAQDVTCARVTIKNNAEQVPGIFSGIRTVRYKDSFARSMVIMAPD
jgi:hypothetical protein